ncbi:uncharacterized protein LOC117335976 [Pecten maximus]|uniref:uncharacterized protein LOC117335976 n=1 Tax=Pecten maximus TaxID=6579 RepID=UPI0014587E35|nr:uncharacterized protein LOC117335976 [Pecten maximus]
MHMLIIVSSLLLHVYVTCNHFDCRSLTSYSSCVTGTGELVTYLYNSHCYSFSGGIIYQLYLHSYTPNMSTNEIEVLDSKLDTIPEEEEQATDMSSQSEEVSELSTQEVMNIIAAFKQLKVKPEASTVHGTVSWLRSYMTSPAGNLTPKQEDSERAEALKPPPIQPRILVAQPPRLPVFSGDGKGDVTYDLWRYEVESLQKEDFTKDQIAAAIRRSLRGEASRIAMRLRPGTPVSELLLKMESIYGTVDKPESVLATFYSARQGKDEDVTTWGCRLEDLLSKACQKHPFPVEEQNGMLREMFWSGLVGHLKDTTGYLYETIKDFDQLRVAVRRVEKDKDKRREEGTKATPAKAAVDQKSQFDELKGMIHQLAGEVEKLRDNPGRPIPPRGQGQYGNPKHHSDRKSAQIPNTQENRRRDNPTDEPVCWRCNQPGHLRIGCKVRLDHSKQPLNSNMPTSGGS